MNSTHPIWPGTPLLWVGKFSKFSVGPAVTAEGSRSPPRALFGQFAHFLLIITERLLPRYKHDRPVICGAMFGAFGAQKGGMVTRGATF